MLLLLQSLTKNDARCHDKHESEGTVLLIIFESEGTVLLIIFTNSWNNMRIFSNIVVPLHHPNTSDMPRQVRKRSGTGVYHVMLRGINRQDIFEDESDYQQMIACLRSLTERYDENGHLLQPLCALYAYCLMSNHIHLLMRERDDTVSEVVKKLGITYAHYFNKKYGRNGHLFQDRFRSEPVDSMEYFVILLRYIHQNPVKSGIVETVEDYPWSSWNEYVGQDILGNPLCAVSSVLARIDRQNLVGLVGTPVNDYKDILDIETEERQSLSDDDIRTFLLNTHGIANPLMIQSLERVRRNYVLKSVKDFGAGIRQLSRLTGVSFGVIQKL